ncbi:MAG TPA: CotH kinase family protein [Phycisphaerales bacterium]|nr:CotH kinase family protein [Phycisphaerales bacterium]
MLYWWVQDEAAAQTDNGTRCSLWYLGRFYDNVFVRLRGQSSAEWPKPHFKLDFNSGHYFTFREGVDPVEEINLQSTYSDKSYIRQELSWEVYRDAGAPGCESEMVRVQRNGAFYSVACFVEQPDEEYLTRNGLDNGGALYKMYNECTDPNGGVEKKTREHEDNADLAALVSGVALPTGPALTTYMFDNVDIPRTISYIAATTLIHDNDHVAKNYYIYRDTEGTGEWLMLPWDKDLTFGRNYGAGGGVLSDGIWADDDPMSHPLFGDASHPKIDGPYNRFIDAMHREPTIRRMYLRRLRTLMDELLQAPGTPMAQRVLENRINELQSLCGPDVALDRAKWGNPYGANQDLATALGILKTQYLDPRRVHLFQTHTVSNGGLIPAAQAAAPVLEFGVIERSPASGDQDEEYIEIYNPSPDAVDISGWQLEGDVAYTFKPGTVVVGQRTMYVSPNVTAFRARAQSPRGGEGRFVQGDYAGHLASPAQDLRLIDTTGRVVAYITACPADFDESGFLDTDDYDAFVRAFELGEETADFDASGFVDTDDFDAFVRAFELGC